MLSGSQSNGAPIRRILSVWKQLKSQTRVLPVQAPNMVSVYSKFLIKIYFYYDDNYYHGVENMTYVAAMVGADNLSVSKVCKVMKMLRNRFVKAIIDGYLTIQDTTVKTDINKTAPVFLNVKAHQLTTWSLDEFLSKIRKGSFDKAQMAHGEMGTRERFLRQILNG